MFFKKRSEEEKLQKEYERLTKKAHALSVRDRKQSDLIYARAQEVADKLGQLESR